MTEKESEYSDIIIENSIATWPINIVGDINGLYLGTFKFRCFLTPLQVIAANRRYRELLGANPTMAGEHESFLAYALSQLKERVVEAPPFWTATLQTDSMAGNLPDENVITTVLNAAIGAEVKYRNQLKQKKEEAIKRAKEAAEKMLESQADTKEDEEAEDEGET